MSKLATEEELARAHGDASFRHHLMARHLDLLLQTLNAIRLTAPDPGPRLQEGIELAVELAERLQGSGDKGAVQKCRAALGLHLRKKAI